MSSKFRPKPGVSYDAGELLDRMRPKVEECLKLCAQEFGEKMSNAPSQSMRASCAIPLLREAIRLERALSGSSGDYVVNRTRRVILLEDFMRVHHTVSMMEQGTYSKL